MDRLLFRNSSSGRLVKTDDGLWAFVPNSLPPELIWDASFSSLLSNAARSLGVLVGLGETLPNPHLLIYPFIRREAVLSSRIEGTRSTLSELFLSESTQVKEQEDIKEVMNYVTALEYGISRLQKSSLSLALVCELHKILMQDVRGVDRKPGEYRDCQNWIGPPGCNKVEARFIPPPVPEMKKALKQLEKFLLSENSISPLVKAALIHSQFETIHPFHDGNGRIGRLLIILFLHKRKLLPKPLLYLSAFFEKYSNEYRDLLLKVCQHGAWRAWIEFFLRGVIDQSQDAIMRARHLVKLQESYRKKVHEEGLSPSAGRVLDLIFMRPVINIKSGAKALKLTFPAVSKAMKQLERVGILRETTQAKRDRVYEASEILKILEEEI
jgi:Fic family protein